MNRSLTFTVGDRTSTMNSASTVHGCAAGWSQYTARLALAWYS
jgi:uncharacterized protein YciW